jgi:hypothetical protein
MIPHSESVSSVLFYRKNKFISQKLQSNDFIDSAKLGFKVKGNLIEVFVNSQVML